MTIDSVQPALGIRTEHPRQDANGKSGRESRHDGKPGPPGPDHQEQESLVLNSLGQVIGKTINVTA